MARIAAAVEPERKFLPTGKMPGAKPAPFSFFIFARESRIVGMQMHGNFCIAKYLLSQDDRREACS
jgi:hypothetical protein